MAVRAIHVSVPAPGDDFPIDLGDELGDVEPFCKQALKDVRALCRDAGITTAEQRNLKGRKATRALLRDAVLAAGEALRPGELFVLSFTGHGSQVEDASFDELDGADEAWCLYDNFLIDDELGKLIADAFPREAHVVVVSDCCYSSGLSGLRAMPNRSFQQYVTTPWVPRRAPGSAGTPRVRKPKARVVMAGSAEGLRIVSTAPTLARRLHDHVFVDDAFNPDCSTYRALAKRLALGPVSERATLWTNLVLVEALQPFAALG